MADRDHLARLVRARLHVVVVPGPLRTRVRAALRSMTPVFESGAANGAITAYGWHGAVVVPVAVAASLLLSRLLRRRLPT